LVGVGVLYASRILRSPRAGRIRSVGSEVQTSVCRTRVRPSSSWFCSSLPGPAVVQNEKHCECHHVLDCGCSGAAHLSLSATHRKCPCRVELLMRKSALIGFVGLMVAAF